MNLIYEFFELFYILRYTIKNKYIHLSEHKDYSTNIKKIRGMYKKSISTLRRQLNRLVESEYLKIESARKYQLKGVHFVYCSTSKLERAIISLTNQLLSLINFEINFTEIIDLDLKLLEDVISRSRLYHTQKLAKLLDYS